jgi:hypothetical protein
VSGAGTESGTGGCLALPHCVEREQARQECLALAARTAAGKWGGIKWSNSMMYGVA